MAARGAGGCTDAGKKGGKVVGFRRRNWAQIAGWKATDASRSQV